MDYRNLIGEMSAHPDIELPPEPPELFDLTRLPDPPADFKVGTWSAQDFTPGRQIYRAQCKMLARFHFWGIQYLGPRSRATGPKILRSLWKLCYYMQEQHRPRDFHDLVDFDRDSGPRLLQYNLIPDPLPYSRLYPTMPDERARPGPGYRRPADAPVETPDSWIERFLLPVRSRKRRSARDDDAEQPKVPERQNKRQRTEVDLTTQPQVTDEVDFSLDWTHSVNLPFVTPGPTPDVAIPVNNTAEANLPSLDSLNSNPTAPDPTVILPAPFQAKAITDAVEKVVMQFAYADLERHPSASPRQSRSYLTATTNDHLSLSQIGMFPATANVKLSPVDLQLNENGLIYPYRGRGPVWSNMSCAIDSVMVMGMLCNAGCTIADRREGWQSKFTTLEKAFIEACNINWDVLNENTSIYLRDSFWRRLCDKYPLVFRFGQANPAWSLWAEATRNFGQFHFSLTEIMNPCVCQRSAPTTTSESATVIVPPYQDGDDKGVPVSKLVERTIFNSRYSPCQHCGSKMGVNHERRTNELPLRLVMTFDHRCKIRNHTESLVFRYVDAEGQKQTAMYRWLGGLYCSQDHARVYWTDAERGEFDSGQIRMYDGSLNKGLIVGGIMPFHRDERVPLEWVHGPASPTLIYERIMNPSADVLGAAAQAVSNMMSLALQEKSILTEHIPWSRSNDTATVANGDPWPRILPQHGERFYEARYTGMSVNFSAHPNAIASSSSRRSRSNHSTDDAMAALLLRDMTGPDAQFDPKLQEQRSAPQPPQTPNIFDSMFDDPFFLVNHPNLGPSETSLDDGMLNLPSLPQSPENDFVPQPTPPQPESAPFSPSQFLNFPDSPNDIIMNDASPGSFEHMSICHSMRAPPQQYRLYIISSRKPKRATDKPKRVTDNDKRANAKKVNKATGKRKGPAKRRRTTR